MPAVYEGLGIEELVDVVAGVLRDKMDEAVAYQQTRGNARDLSNWIAIGNDPDDFVATTLDSVPASNFHAGSLPSFIQADERTENYPLVAVVPGRIARDPEDVVMDQMGVVQNFVSIHVFAKAIDPNLSWRKSVRLAEAVYQIITGDNRVNRKIQKTPNNVILSEPWKFYANGEDHGAELWWFAIGTEYQIKNYIRPPTPV